MWPIVSNSFNFMRSESILINREVFNKGWSAGSTKYLVRGCSNKPRKYDQQHCYNRRKKVTMSNNH